MPVLSMLDPDIHGAPVACRSDKFRHALGTAFALLTANEDDIICGVGAADGHDDGHIMCGRYAGDKVKEYGDAFQIKPFNHLHPKEYPQPPPPNPVEVNAAAASAKLRSEGLKLAREFLHAR